MLERALEVWNRLPREERLLPDEILSDAPEILRPERFYPEGGLVLRVNSRDLPRETPLSDWRARAWNLDYAWFTKEEARQFLPEGTPEVGQAHDVPAPLIRRIARAHLVDNVRGQTVAYGEEDIQRARLTSTVTAIRDGVVSLRLEGETRTEAAGRWAINDRWDADNPHSRTRGFEAKLMGTAQYDLNQNRFIAFEMVAAGERWGGTQYNVRKDDLDPAPLGIAFTLAGDTPTERVAPAFYRAYGWK